MRRLWTLLNSMQTFTNQRSHPTVCWWIQKQAYLSNVCKHTWWAKCYLEQNLPSGFWPQVYPGMVNPSTSFPLISSIRLWNACKICSWNVDACIWITCTQISHTTACSFLSDEGLKRLHSDRPILSQEHESIKVVPLTRGILHFDEPLILKHLSIWSGTIL